LLDPEEKEIIGVANFSNVVRGSFHACYLGYSIAQKWQGQGLINLYQVIKNDVEYFIKEGRYLFEARNDPEAYYKTRQEFNLR
ncbi:DNA adenine methylase, partial [Salmonella enterica subsp. enterica serovar Montevideo]|nr:DNA adenine methylase [Salmonella enterica subsp. enterica serovar Montevideo]